MVLTPGGYRHPSLVHHLPEGHKVRRRKRELQIVHRRTQRIVARYSFAPEAVPDPIIPGLGSGWATSVSWLNPTGTPISQFTTTWTVPPDPAAGDAGQVVYLFNGLQNPEGTNLMQPVLQWGATQLGGGPYWTISNWYIDDSGHAVHSHFLQVPSGDVLTGVIARGPDSGGLCSYTVGFQEYPYLNVPAAGVDPSPLAVEVLESYHIGDCSEYPPTPSTSASSIFIAADGTAPVIGWTPHNSNTGCNEHCTVVGSTNPGGEVEILYS
jgi:hypothetical protein